VKLFPKSRRRRAAAVLLLLAYTLLMVFGGCADKLILYPSTEPLYVRGTTRLEVPAGDGRAIEVWTARSRGAAADEPQAFALEFIGNASRAEYTAAAAAQEWGERPVEVWALNYAGYGGSRGPARLASIPTDAAAAYDALRARAGNRPIFLTGQSLGTTAALHVAASRPAAGMVLWSPPPLRDMILKRFGWWNLWLLAGPVAMHVPPQLDSIRNARNVNVPAVFVLTGQDTVVPLKYQSKVEQAYRGEKRYVRMPDSEHNAVLEGVAATEYQAALDWLWSRAVAPQAQPAPAIMSR
jgi:pimeloyl-ACP methyl ester carboxylesterase